MILYSDLVFALFPLSSFSGFTPGPVVFLRKSVRGAAYEADLIRHERTHVRQFWRNPLRYCFGYLLSRRIRAELEIEAFANEVLPYRSTASYSTRLLAVSHLLSELYRTGLSVHECFERIQAEVERLDSLPTKSS